MAYIEGYFLLPLPGSDGVETRMYYHNSAQTSHFLSKEIWDQAVKLLEYQINQKKKNKHYNTLSMHYYESVLPDTSCLKTDDYFNEKIGTDLFYGLEKEFKIFSYLLPKPGLGLRSYTFFSYPLRVLYYAIGLYLVKITQEYIDDFRPKYKNIRSYYGGNLRFNKDDIVLNYNSTQYKKSYKQFRYHVRKEALENPDHRVVLRLDIKDYFDEISIPSLLNNISRRIKTSTSSSYNFDPTTHDAITFFFRYLTNNRDGIPQSEHDLIGGFIGYLYLVFADFLFHDEIAREYGLLKDHKIIRYVDDIYIFIEFDSNVKQAEREGFIDSLSARIADILHYKLNLKLNTKSRLYWLNNEDDLDELLRNLKKVSGS